MSSSQQKPWVVLKFGGTSVAHLTCWQAIARIIRRHLAQGHRPLVVCSALTGMTNKLSALCEKGAAREKILSEVIAAYEHLANELQVQPCSDLFAELTALVRNIAPDSTIPPKSKARLLAFGELLSTTLGAAFLNQQALDTDWKDARHCLVSLEKDAVPTEVRYLAATCSWQQDPLLKKNLDACKSRVIMTQGFIASNDDGETVLLGRGGSDTSAAYFAAKLGAARCEIWTDVPGIYSANPHEIPEARLLKTLDYEEAQEIASMGGKVLHPYSILPVKMHGIPLYVACTCKPERPGTEIRQVRSTQETPIKSILIKRGIRLIQIETLYMWQQIGFLADVFVLFKKHHLSVDLVSTSESTMTVSLDLQIRGQDQASINALLDDLNQFCKATEIGPTAIISFVGKNIRSVLHHIGPALKVFEEQKIYLISQAANDLNLSVVVDEAHVERLARKLHATLIEENATHPVFEQSWQEEFLTPEYTPPTPWWETRRQDLLTLAATTSPCYVYDAQTLKKSVQAVKNISAVDRIFYAMKANNAPEVLRLFEQMGLGFECVSTGELHTIFSLFPHIDPKRILFTPNFARKEEYIDALNHQVYLTIDNLHPLQAWPELFDQKEILLRCDPGKGYGHHRHVCTGGKESKFGIAYSEIDALKKLLKESGAKVIGLHAHTGSGILEASVWRETAEILLGMLKDFPSVRILNCGGGLGVPEKLGQAPLDTAAMNASLLTLKKTHPHLEFWLEPGRFLVAEAGVLLARVTQIKTKGELHYIGIDTGMNSLIRPSLYGSYHPIVNLTRLEEPCALVAHIVGPICESGDTLGFARPMPITKEGDVILIANTGAYGRVMSSNYNLRPPAEEIFL